MATLQISLLLPVCLEYYAHYCKLPLSSIKVKQIYKINFTYKHDFKITMNVKSELLRDSNFLGYDGVLIGKYQCSEGASCLHPHSRTLYNIPPAMASQSRKLESCQHLCENLRSWIKSLANKDFSSSRKQCTATNCTYTYIANTRRNGILKTANSSQEETEY